MRRQTKFGLLAYGRRDRPIAPRRQADFGRSRAAVAFSPDDSKFFVGDIHGHCTLWNTATGAKLGALDTHTGKITGASSRKTAAACSPPATTARSASGISPPARSRCD